jgi:two-component sensor histidine kinase
MIVLTGHNIASKEAYAAALQGRIAAMAQAHGLLTRRRWQGVDLVDIVGLVQQAYPEAVSVEGQPGCILRAKDALNLALVLHELATNAAKHGALSVPDGQVRVTWRVEGKADAPRVRFTWSEVGGPAVALPARSGFGLQLIQGALPNAAISIDGVVRGTADSTGRFRIEVANFSSPTCQVTVSDGATSAQAQLAGCTPSAPPPSASPTPTPAPQGATGSISIIPGGNGSGTITSQPAGINCTITGGNGSGTCTAFFPAGSIVRLDARPAADTQFQGWRGLPGCADPSKITVFANTNIACQPGFQLKF